MFRVMITPIFRSARLCVTACGIMHPRCCQPVAWKLPLQGYRPATSWVPYTTSCNTQSSAPEDGRDHLPKHVGLIGIINKPLLLHLVGVYIIYVNDTRSNKYQTYHIYEWMIRAEWRWIIQTDIHYITEDISIMFWKFLKERICVPHSNQKQLCRTVCKIHSVGWWQGVGMESQQNLDCRSEVNDR